MFSYCFHITPFHFACGFKDSLEISNMLYVILYDVIVTSDINTLTVPYNTGVLDIDVLEFFIILNNSPHPGKNL